MTKSASQTATLTQTNAFRILWISAALFLGLFAITAAHAQTRIAVAEVNGETIFLDEVMQLTEQLPDEYRRQPLSNYFDQLVDEIIDTRLAAKAGAEAGLDADPIVAEAMQLAMRKVLAEAWLATEIRKSVTDEAIEEAYDRFVADSVSREEVRASHILLADAEDAKTLITEINLGADFAELAKEFSTGPSGPNGGDLGYFGRGAMVPAFEAAAFDLDVGAHTLEPVQTQFGWHIIKLVDRRTAEAPSLEELGPQIGQNLTRQALVLQLEKLRATATVTRRSFSDVRDDAQAAQSGQ